MEVMTLDNEINIISLSLKVHQHEPKTMIRNLDLQDEYQNFFYFMLPGAEQDGIGLRATIAIFMMQNRMN